LAKSKPPFYILLSLLLFLFISNESMAAKFRGGYFTYKYLGDGKYELLIKGYWDKSSVPFLYPRFKGSL
jgi:hypothetical protein